MKTVIDAVNEHKGEWPAGYVMSLYTEGGEIFEKDFNQCVEELSKAEWMNVKPFEATCGCCEYEWDCLPYQAMTMPCPSCGDKPSPRADIKPVKPVYTQEFEYCDNSGTHSITSQHILCCADTGRVVAVFYNENDLMEATGLTKKVVLEDGKAYKFSYMNIGALYGVYNKYDDELIGSGASYELQFCTNIKLLT